MPTDLRQLLVGLATDPVQAKLFWQNPARFAEGADLTPSQTTAILSRDPQMLATAIQLDLAANSVEIADDSLDVQIIVVVLPE